jgi:SSS family solute:Na+ symporter
MRTHRTNEDYFVGGRQMKWWAVGISLFATAFSSLSFVALPSEAAYRDYHLLVTYLFIPLVITPVLWWIFVPTYLRLGLTSVYEYLEVRFSRSVRRVGTILFALYGIGWMGAMVYATGRILQPVLKSGDAQQLSDVQLAWILVAVGLFATLYTTLGGIKAVIWTDVLQAATLGGGVLVVLLMTFTKIDGGWTAVFDVGRDKFAMFDMDLDLTRRATFFSACASGLFVYLPGYAISQITVQRYLCTPNLRDARRALAINAVVATVVALLFFFMGTTLYAYYQQAGGETLPQLKHTDQLLPLFVFQNFPGVGLAGLLLAALFAAVMSTIDSGINSLTAVVAYDWLSGRRFSVLASRLLCALFGICVIAASLLVRAASRHQEHVIDIIFIIAGAFLGVLLGIFLLGMFSSRANTPGALIGLVAGALSLAYVWTQTDIHGWWYGAYSCLPTFGVGLLASRLFPPPPPEKMRGLVYRSRFSAAPPAPSDV